MLPEIMAVALIGILTVSLLRRYLKNRKRAHLQARITLLRWQIRNRLEQLSVAA